MEIWKKGDQYAVILFYKYLFISNTEKIREAIQNLIQIINRNLSDNVQHSEGPHYNADASIGSQVMGRILIAREGINGTLAGSLQTINYFINEMKNIDERFSQIDWKFSYAKGDVLPFLSLSVRVVDELISIGNDASKILTDEIQYEECSYGGLSSSWIHLSAEQFHEALNSLSDKKDDSIVLDIRNEFEFDIGHFDCATGLNTFTYSETFDAMHRVLEKDAIHGKENETAINFDRKIFMYCTGGIRCEKASTYLQVKGYHNVFQLQGGIHKYLEVYPDGGHFIGKNFVFDSRVALSPQQYNDPIGTTCDPSVESKIVGQCIDCCQNFDQYSGEVTCTVCRMPVLVCRHCVATNPHSGEYYCSRHRDLKGIYFTMLDRFNGEELRSQLVNIQDLLSKSETHWRLHRSKLLSDQIDNSDMVMFSKNRRRTLRKQLNRIDKILKSEFATINPNHDTTNPNLNSTNSNHHTTKPNHNTTQDIEHALQPTEQQSADTLGITTIKFNPQSRGGWGFWR